MVQAIIYKAFSSNANKALSKLIETIWLRGNKILVYCADKAKLAAFDNALWTYEQLSFLPHVIEGDELIDKTPVILLSSPNNPNNANIIVCLDADMPETAPTFDKLVYMYEGGVVGEQEKAINFIQQLKSNSIEVIEYQQDKSGAWQKT